MCRVHSLDWCQRFARLCGSLFRRDSAKRRKMEVADRGGGGRELEKRRGHWSLGVPPTMHHSRQGET